MWDPTNDPCEIYEYPPSSRKHENKENNQLSPVKDEELSFYENPNFKQIATNRRVLEDFDQNSQDSGYLTNSRFCESSASFSSNSIEDDFFEDFFDIETNEDNDNSLSDNLNKLISDNVIKAKNKISPKYTLVKPQFRRAISLQNDQNTPNTSRVRSCLFKTTDTEVRTFKRPEAPTQSGSPSKKAKTADDSDFQTIIKRPILQRAISATEESIMCAVQRSSVEPDLIGDFTKNFYLPLTQGRHQDLKSITPTTLAQLLQGNFNSNVASYKVIDCRYPYEYDGGHIYGAVNIFTKEQCMELLINHDALLENLDKRNILVFHCEFSSERGPNLCRYLRKQDRQLNQDDYPNLRYPEIYILEGGYKNFFEQFSQLCVPIAYKNMLHPEHESDLRFFRQKCKTWNVDSRQRSQRGNLKRLGL